MNQIPNIEEIVNKYWAKQMTLTLSRELETDISQLVYHQLQKAREEERERIEAVFKEHVPPHAMDLEDSVWLKRLLNKAFQHENIY